MNPDTPLVCVGFISRLVVDKDFDDQGASACTIEIWLRSQAISSSEESFLGFRDVLDLRIENLSANIRLQMTIYDISDRNLEKTRFRVVDEENGVISFTCSEIKTAKH